MKEALFKEAIKSLPFEAKKWLIADWQAIDEMLQAKLISPDFAEAEYDSLLLEAEEAKTLMAKKENQ